MYISDARFVVKHPLFVAVGMTTQKGLGSVHLPRDVNGKWELSAASVLSVFFRKFEPRSKVMPGRYCAVFACNTDGSAHTGITLCKFPQQTSIRREWIRFVQDNRTDFLPPRAIFYVRVSQRLVCRPTSRFFCFICIFRKFKRRSQIIPGVFCAVFCWNMDGSYQTGITIYKIPDPTSLRRAWVRFVGGLHEHRQISLLEHHGLAMEYVFCTSFPMHARML